MCVCVCVLHITKAKMTHEKYYGKFPKPDNFNFGHVPKGQIDNEKNETHPKINNLNFGHVPKGQNDQ